MDTEFIREKTYYPRLCLIQVAGPEEAVLIDPLAPGMDLSPLFALFNKSSVLKVFHAASQDLEIFYQLSGTLPKPLFDTQIAAMVCGFGEAASYAKLAEVLAGVEIDKTSRFTDWSRRPLSRAQQEYALSDVVYLRDVYKALAEQLKTTDREAWVSEEMLALRDTANYIAEPFEMWKKIRTRSAAPKFLHMVREVAAWREENAQALDIPRTHLLKDQTLLEIAASHPVNITELRKVRGISRPLSQTTVGESLIERMVSAKNAAPDPSIFPKRKKALKSSHSSMMELLKVLLKLKAEEYKVADRLIATNDDLTAMIEEPKDPNPVTNGWRNEVFGKEAIALIQGRVALKIEGNRTVIVTT
ncbi:MAG: ribonuclease [Rickettsiales bacterium]|nr:ribonuclease [Rickettsiales bacterium]